MPATTTAIDIRPLTKPSYPPIPLAAATRIPAGALVALNAAGLAINAADLPNAKVIGVSPETIDNAAGPTGAQTIVPLIGPFSGYLNDLTAPCTAAHIGRAVFATDNQTLQSTPGTNSVRAGILLGFNPDGTLQLNIIPNF